MCEKSVNSVIPSEQRARLHEILDIVIDGNGFENRSKDETGNLPTIMFEFMGHVSRLEVRIYGDGWDYDCKGRQYFEFSTKEPIGAEEVAALRNAVEFALSEKEAS